LNIFNKKFGKSLVEGTTNFLTRFDDMHLPTEITCKVAKLPTFEHIP
jgi:hypothetical protein